MVSLSMGSKTSTSSEDCKNWMAVHSKHQEVIYDVCEVGKSIGLKIKGGCSNMFGVLSMRAGSKNEG